MEAKNEYKKKVEFGQDVYDMCIQEYGSLNALFLFLADNPSVDLKRNLVAGEELKFRIVLPADVPVNKNLMDEYRANQTRVNNHDEVETLEDGCPILTAAGEILLTANSIQILLANCEVEPVQPEIMSGFTTSDGNVIVTAVGEIILPEHEPISLGASTGFAILTSIGEEIEIHPPVLTYIFTAQSEYLQTAIGDFIIT